MQQHGVPRRLQRKHAESKAFEPAPVYAGYLERQKAAATGGGAAITGAAPILSGVKSGSALEPDMETLVRLITEQVVAAMSK